MSWVDGEGTSSSVDISVSSGAGSIGLLLFLVTTIMLCCNTQTGHNHPSAQQTDVCTHQCNKKQIKTQSTLRGWPALLYFLLLFLLFMALNPKYYFYLYIYILPQQVGGPILFF